jgi:hypothetical protein
MISSARPPRVSCRSHDPQPARKLGIVTANLLDESLASSRLLNGGLAHACADLRR